MSADRQADRLCKLRKALGWSNKELSMRTGIAPPLLSQYQHARKAITPNNAWRIAKATGVTIDYLLSGERSGLAEHAAKRLPPE